MLGANQHIPLEKQHIKRQIYLVHQHSPREHEIPGLHLEIPANLSTWAGRECGICIWPPAPAVLELFSFPAVFFLPSGSVYSKEKKKRQRLVKSKGAFTQKKSVAIGSVNNTLFLEIQVQTACRGLPNDAWTVLVSRNLEKIFLFSWKKKIIKMWYKEAAKIIQL